MLNDLQKRNNSLKSKLRHQQLKYNNFSYRYYKKYSLLIINDYKKHKSLYIAALNNNLDYNVVFEWFIQGQLGNSKFRGFYLAVKNITGDVQKDNYSNSMVELDEDYVISQYGDGWSYKAYRDGEKIFIIANEIDDLKNKIKSKNLPID